jgi:hypothetical protein
VGESSELLDCWYGKLLEEREMFKMQGQQTEARKNGENKVMEVVRQEITFKLLQNPGREDPGGLKIEPKGTLTTPPEVPEGLRLP